MTLRFSVALICMMVFLAAPRVHAQLPLTGLERSLTLSMTPEYPAPGESVTLAIESYGLDLNRSTIVWYQGTKELARGIGKTSASVMAGELGSNTSVRAIAEAENGIVATVEAHIRPTEVDLLWSADSYVPPFFKGRALPGTNASIRAQALARFQKEDGAPVPASDIIYTWYTGNTRIASGRGTSSVTFPGPTLFGAETVRVVAESADGTRRGEARARIISKDPVAELYENHPLFGILYHRAIVAGARSSESEQEVVAVPYFAHIASPRDPSLSYAWEVNGRSITVDPAIPDSLTIVTEGYTGPADIKLTLTSTADIFLRTLGSWQLLFSPAIIDLFGTNPFGSGN